MSNALLALAGASFVLASLRAWPRRAALLVLLGAAVALLAAGCASPDGAWVAGGAPRAAELGVLSDRNVALPGAPRWEAALGYQHLTGSADEEGRCRSASMAGGRKHPKDAADGTPAADDFIGRAGLRWYLGGLGLPDLHVGGGLETDLRPYARLGADVPISPSVTLGLDLLDRDGRCEGLLGLRWSR